MLCDLSGPVSGCMTRWQPPMRRRGHPTTKLPRGLLWSCDSPPALAIFVICSSPKFVRPEAGGSGTCALSWQNGEMHVTTLGFLLVDQIGYHTFFSFSSSTAWRST